jgi:hypothetical protein
VNDFNGLEFDDQSPVDKEVNVTPPNDDVLVRHANFWLPFELDPIQGHLHAERGFADLFKQSRAKNSVNFDGGGYHPTREHIEVGAGFGG